MIFAVTHEWITDRAPETGMPKTLTSRLAKPGDVVETGIGPAGEPIIRRVLRGGVVLYAVEATRAICTKRMGRSIGRIRLVEIVLAPRADAISPSDALAEGFATVAGFQRTWKRLHGEQALATEVYRIRFVYLGPEPERRATRSRKPAQVEQLDDGRPDEEQLANRAILDMVEEPG